MKTEIYTSGVYGSTTESFFVKIKSNMIDTFVAKACHRSLVADKLNKNFGLVVKHI